MYLQRIVALFALAGIPLIAAPVACSTASAAYYEGLGEGCTSGPFTFKNFNWFSVTGPEYVTVASSDVFLSPSFTGNQVSVSLNSDALNISGTSRITANLEYTVDPPPPILDDFSLELEANSPVFPGLARITSLICAGDLFSNGCTAGVVRTLTVQHLGDGNPGNVLFASVDFPFAVNLIDVRTTLVLEANGKSSQIDGFVQSTVPSSDSPVPEPATALATMMGLGLIGLVRRDTRSKACAIAFEFGTKIGRKVSR